MARLLGLFSLLGALLLASGAAAQGRGRASGGQDDPQQSAEYRRLVQQALDEFQRGNWDEAAGLFAQAHKLSPSARTLRGMGLAAFEGRRYVDALRDLRAALESTVNPLTAEQRAEVTETVSRAEHYVAQLELTVEPSDAEVTVNGAVVPAQAGGARLMVVDPGVLEVRASAPGYDPELRQLRMVSGVRQQVALQLSRVGEGKAAANVPLDGPAPVARRRSGPPFQIFAWLSVGLAGAAGIATVVAWQVREGAAKDFNNRKCKTAELAMDGECSDLASRVDSAETAEIVSGVAAGVFLTTGVVFFLLDSSQDGSAEAATACGAGPGDLGVACRLRF
jgi:hypothetical protein